MWQPGFANGMVFNIKYELKVEATLTEMDQVAVWFHDV